MKERQGFVSNSSSSSFVVAAALPRHIYTCTTDEPDSNAVVIQVVMPDDDANLCVIFYSHEDAEAFRKLVSGKATVHSWQWTVTRNRSNFCYAVYHCDDTWIERYGARYHSLTKVFGRYDEAVAYCRREPIKNGDSHYYEIEQYSIQGTIPGQVKAVKFFSNDETQEEYA